MKSREFAWLGVSAILLALSWSSATFAQEVKTATEKDRKIAAQSESIQLLTSESLRSPVSQAPAWHSSNREFSKFSSSKGRSQRLTPYPVRVVVADEFARSLRRNIRVTD